MTEKRTSLEIIAPTIEEAVSKGLSDLGLSHANVDVEVLDEGSRGLFGLGVRQARVRLTIKSPLEMEATSKESALPSRGMNHTPSDRLVVEQPEEAEPPPRPSPEDYILNTARETVTELLDKMRVEATVTAEFGVVTDARSRVPVLVHIHGDDLSILIGRRAETLNALQFISALILNKEIGRAIPLVVDVEGYRTRREEQLRRMARRMADQAIKTGRRQVLEPMPANERRIVHIELRKNPYVTTESINQEPYRKVTIIPKE